MNFGGDLPVVVQEFSNCIKQLLQRRPVKLRAYSPSDGFIDAQIAQKNGQVPEGDIETDLLLGEGL